jgi:surfeit locus 1 family protein
MTFRPLPILTVATLVALAILISLGAWQLQRRAEKHALLEQIETRALAAPAAIEILLATGDYAAHRRATAQGAFIPGREAFVYAPRADKGPTVQGYKLVSAFALLSGGTILIDRGWVPAAWRERPATSAASAGKIEIEGVLRPSSRPATFTPPPDLAKRTFFQRDTVAIGKVLNLSLATTLVFEATTRADGGPEPLPSAVNIPDNHLNYALTWFSLAMVLLVIYLRFHHVRGRLKFGR